MSASVMAMRSGLAPVADWARAGAGVLATSAASSARKGKRNGEVTIGFIQRTPGAARGLDATQSMGHGEGGAMTRGGLNEATALELARRLDGGETTAERIVQACLERIAAREPTV